MDPMTIAALVGTVGEVAASLIGDALAAGDKRKAMQIYSDAYEKAQGMKPPAQQTMTAIEQASSGLSSFQEDPRLRSRQMQALDALAGEVETQGLGPQAQAAYNQARLESEGMAAAQRGAAEARMAARGATSGSGSLAAELGAGQAATNRLAQQGVAIAGDARSRYLQALESLGGAAGGMRGQEFGMAAQRAAAQDAINRFNALQRSEAQKYNLEAGQRDFENQLRIMGAQQQAGGQYAGALRGQAADTQETAGRYGQAGSSLLKAGATGAKAAAKQSAWEKAHPGEDYPWWKD